MKWRQLPPVGMREHTGLLIPMLGMAGLQAGTWCPSLTGLLPFPRRRHCVLCCDALTQIEINETLIAKFTLFGELLEVRNRHLIQPNRYRLLPPLGIRTHSRVYKVVFLVHGDLRGLITFRTSF